MGNGLYGKTVENLRNRINVTLVSNKKDYLKWISKRNYMSKEIFDSVLVAMLKSKVTLKLKRIAYVGMCILNLSKVLTYGFHSDYNENKYNNN